MSSKSYRFGVTCAGFLLAVLGSTAQARETNEASETSEANEANEANEAKRACVKANGDAQALRLEGKLGAARALFVQCGDPTCPALVRDDCAQRLDELERVQPTIVLEVKDASGADATGVALVIDGRPLPGTLQGRALRVDPGEHELEFTAAGFAPAKRRFVLNEGEKERHERIVLERLPVEAPPPLAPTPAVVTSAPPRVEASTNATARTQRTVGLVVGGVGLAVVVVGGVFGVLTFSSVAAQNRDCGAGPGCEDRPLALSDHSRGVTDGAVSTATFITGAALVAGGAALLLTSRSRQVGPSIGLRLTPSVGPGSGGLSLRGEF